MCFFRTGNWASEMLPDDAPCPRLCVIVKDSPSQEYGYNLHAEREKPHFIGTVDPDSPAERGGLKPGDRIFAVNGQSIIGEHHKQVVQKIKENPLQCALLVVTEDEAEWYAKHKIPVTLELPNIVQIIGQNKDKNDNTPFSLSRSEHESDSPIPTAHWYVPKEQERLTHNILMSDESRLQSPDFPRPRLCKLRKNDPSEEFGFNLHAESKRGHFVGAVDKGGIGEKAGLEMGQRIVGVNGQLIYPTSAHKQVVSLIKMNPLRTDLLVASEMLDRWYTENHIEFSFDRAILYNAENETPSEDASNRMDSHRSASHEHEDFQNTPDMAGENDYYREESSTNRDQPIPTLEYVDSQTIQDDNHIDRNDALAYNSAPGVISSNPPLNQETAPPLRHEEHVDERPKNKQDEISDIFMLSAHEARSRLMKGKKDPRRDTTMSLQEKYRLVSNM